MSETVSESYVLGVKEGRSLYNSWVELHGQKPARREIERIIDNLTAQLSRGFSREMCDHFRGERDFWRGRLKVAKS